MKTEAKLNRAIQALRDAADALESLSRSLYHEAKPVADVDIGQTPESVAAEYFLDAMRRNADKLKGRMSAQEVSEAIGKPIGRGDRVSFGMAARLFGAHPGKSGSSRYYLFK